MTQKKKKTSLIMPKWMDCSWRRLACGRDDCPICGRLKDNRARHIASGEDPESIAAALDDVGYSLQEALAAIKEGARRHGIKVTNSPEINEPPPGEFPLYKRLRDWRDDIYDLAENSDMTNSTWLYTEAADDLLWYTNTILIKTYRQLCNRWHLDRGDKYGEEDYAYTRYVLAECARILKESLTVFTKMDIEQKNKLTVALLFLNNLETEIFAI